MFEFKDGNLKKKAYVIINGIEYEVIMPEYEDGTPLSAENLNKAQQECWEVGSIYTTTLEKNPSEILGFGKWEKKNVFHGGELIAYGEMHNSTIQTSEVAKDEVFQFSSNKIPNKTANIKNYVENILTSSDGTFKVAPKGVAGLVKATVVMAGQGGSGCTGLWYSGNNNPLPDGVVLISEGTLISGFNETYGGNSCNYMYEVTDEADVEAEFYVNPKAQPYGGGFAPTSGGLLCKLEVEVYAKKQTTFVWERVE